MLETDLSKTVRNASYFSVADATSSVFMDRLSYQFLKRKSLEQFIKKL